MAHGHELGEMFEELDESGKGGHHRPLLEEAVGRVERGDSDGMIVWKASRFGRDLIDGLIPNPPHPRQQRRVGCDRRPVERPEVP